MRFQIRQRDFRFGRSKFIAHRRGAHRLSRALEAGIARNAATTAAMPVYSIEPERNLSVAPLDFEDAPNGSGAQANSARAASSCQRENGSGA